MYIWVEIDSVVMMPPKLSVKDWLVAGLRRLLAYTDTYQVDKDWQQALHSLCELSKSIIKCYDILSHIQALKLIKKTPPECPYKDEKTE